MKKAFAWLNSNWHKAVTAVILLVITFALVPFDRNWKLFFLFALVGIGAFLINRYDPTPAKIFKPENGVKVLATVAAFMLAFGFFFPKTGGKLWSAVKWLDSAMAEASLPDNLGDLISGSAGARTAPAPVFPVCSGVEDVSLSSTAPSAEVPIQQGCWSGWVKLPQGYAVNFRVQNGDDPQDLLFVNGETFPNDGTKWAGTIPHSNFRIRGGKNVKFATVTIEPK